MAQRLQASPLRPAALGAHHPAPRCPPAAVTAGKAGRTLPAPPCLAAPASVVLPAARSASTIAPTPVTHITTLSAAGCRRLCRLTGRRGPIPPAVVVVCADSIRQRRACMVRQRLSPSLSVAAA